MTKVALNKTTKDFSLSRRTYNWLIQNRGWRFIGTIDMNREGTSVAQLVNANDDPIAVTLTTTATGSGTITRRGTGITQIIGDTVIYDFVPSSGKVVGNVIIDGVDNGAGIASYTFGSLTDNHNMEVVFIDAPTLGVGVYSVSVFGSVGGNVVSKGVNVVADEASLVITAKPYPGFTFDSISVDGTPADITSLTSTSTYTNTFSDLTASHTIAVYFRPTVQLEIAPQKSTKLLWNDLFNKWYMSVSDRSDADLVAAIEAIQSLGPAMANGDGCDITIIQIPNEIVSWEVKRDCNGYEIVTTPYQKWE